MLSKTLRKLRKNCGYTQQYVANALGVERSTYTYYETGKSTPDANTIIKLSKIFRASYLDIFSDEETITSLHSMDDMAHISQTLQNTLSQKEKELIANYRSLPTMERKRIFNEIEKKTHSHEQPNKARSII